MARKKKTEVIEEEIIPAEIINQPITETIETNYMPYAMSVIVSRAIPDIDAALAASVFHFGQIKIPDLKQELRNNNIIMRL